MSRKKQLKLNGSIIASCKAQIENVKNDCSGESVDIIVLEINTSDDRYKYEICKDDNYPDIHQTRDDLVELFKNAKNKFLNIEFSEDADRFYLYLKIQGLRQRKFTGHRR